MLRWTKKMRIPRSLILLACFLIAAFQVVQERDQQQRSLYSYLKDVPEILQLVDRAYVDDVEVSGLMDGAFQGALESVDPGASFVAPSERVMLDSWDVAYSTGLIPAKSRRGLIVLSTVAGSPAAEAGLATGDLIRAINDLPTRGMSLNRARHALLAAEVHITTTPETQFTFQSGPVVFEPATLTDAGTGRVFLKVPVFDSALETHLTLWQPRMSAADSIVLDLRGNALPDENALKSLARLFFPVGAYGEIRSQQSVLGSLVNQHPGALRHKEVTILVDQSTSSTAEAFAFLAQQLGCAQIAGQQTLGLPGRYTAYRLKNGAAIVLSTETISSLSGTTYVGSGIKPDRDSLPLEPVPLNVADLKPH